MAKCIDQQTNNRSDVFAKLSSDLRRAVDVAIIERKPPTYQAVWLHFRLGDFGISYWSFYRYARRLRDRANLAEIAAIADHDDAALEEPIRKLINRRLLDLLLTTHDLESMKAAATLFTAQRHVQRAAERRSRETDDSRIAWARIEHDRNELRIKAEHLEAIRRRFEMREPPRPPLLERTPDPDAQSESENCPRAPLPKGETPDE